MELAPEGINLATYLFLYICSCISIVNILVGLRPSILHGPHRHRVCRLGIPCSANAKIVRHLTLTDVSTHKTKEFSTYLLLSAIYRCMGCGIHDCMEGLSICPLPRSRLSKYSTWSYKHNII